jgi:hypothetical protein
MYYDYIDEEFDENDISISSDEDSKRNRGINFENLKIDRG